MKISKKARITWLPLFALLLSSQASLGASESVAADFQVSLISPRPGTEINPDLPFVITLAITGGRANTSNSCFEYQNNPLEGLTFGAQAIDVNNFGKSLFWGHPGNDSHGVDAGLGGWTLRAIPNGIECSIGVISGISGSGAVANFSQSLTDTDKEWFGTQQSNWSGNDTNYGEYRTIDFAWKLNNVITHNRFRTTARGKPSAQISGLTRGQTIDYTAKFTVTGSASSSLALMDLGANSENGDGSENISCSKNSLTKSIGSDGVNTYTIPCTISFISRKVSAQSLIIVPNIRTEPLIMDLTSKQGVLVNVGAQGTPLCVSKLGEFSNSTSSLKSSLKDYQGSFAKVTNTAGSKLVLADLTSISKTSSENLASIRAIKIDIEDCNLQRESLLTDAVNNDASINQLIEKIKAFINDPVAQKTAQKLADASAKASAAQSIAQSKALYNFGYQLVSGWTTTQLIGASIRNFVLPGKKYLTKPYAQDWCAKLPMIIVNLSARVGFPADSNFIAGCTAAAVKIRFK